MNNNINYQAGKYADAAGYNPEAVISGECLKEFLRLLETMQEKYQQKQDCPPPQQTDASGNPTSEWIAFTHTNEWQRNEILKQVVREADEKGMKKPNASLSWREIIGFVHKYDEPEINKASLNTLKMSILQECQYFFAPLHQIQECTLDRWICERILHAEFSPELCSKGGIINTEQLKKTKRSLTHANVTPESCAYHYLTSLLSYEKRLSPGGLLDVYHRAEVVAHRTDFEAAVAAANTELGKSQLQLKEQDILRQIAADRGFDLPVLQAGMVF